MLYNGEANATVWTLEQDLLRPVPPSAHPLSPADSGAFPKEAEYAEERKS